MKDSRLGLLVVTHGRLALDLADSARAIVGEIESLEAVSIDWNDPVEDSDRRIREAIERVDRGAGVLLLTDMFGGTPTNLAASMIEPERVEIVTGVNLPMLIKFATLPVGTGLLDAAERIAAQGRESIHVGSTLLGPAKPRPPGGAS